MGNPFKRIMLKLSGEALLGDVGYGIDPKIMLIMAKQIKEVHDLGIEIAVVIGGGNIFRGLAASAEGMDRASADYMGMLATVMNAIALQDALEKQGLQTRVQSAIAVQELCEPYVRRRATRHLEKGRVVIFAAGTGNPYFTTDTAAALRAVEMHADILLKATRVDGVYDKDPLKHKDAVRYDELAHMDLIKSKLNVMDATAVTLCEENKLPICVFSLFEHGNLAKIVNGERVGTLIH